MDVAKIRQVKCVGQFYLMGIVFAACFIHFNVNNFVLEIVPSSLFNIKYITTSQPDLCIFVKTHLVRISSGK